MRDPYVYEGTNVLINKAGIRNQTNLDSYESLVVSVSTARLLKSNYHFSSLIDLFFIHKSLFENVYDWAGEPRTINIYKEEYVLNGLSVIYEDYSSIKDAIDDLNRHFKKEQWKEMSKREVLEKTVRYFSKLWRIHAFREGNTRTISILMYFFLISIDYKFNSDIISENAKFFRNALVLASIDQYSEYEHLEKILGDSISFRIRTTKGKNEYQTIKGYNLEKYQYNYHSVSPKK